MGDVAAVLYSDDSGHLLPLSELFWTGEKMVSTHPASSTMEVDCLFCPDCLQVAAVDEDEGMCPKCFACPKCGTTLRATFTKSSWSYSCSHCSFVDATTGTTVEDLESRKSIERDSLAEEFARVIDWQRKWSSSPPPLDEEKTAPLPRVKLQALKTIRCRADVAADKAGIVYKPTPLPLAGDSSMRASRRAKKDSSAALSVARISLHKAPVARRDGAVRLFLELSNPLPTPLDIHLTSHDDEETHSRKILSPYSLRRRKIVVATADVDLEVGLRADDNEPYEDPMLADDESHLVHERGHLAFLIVDCVLPTVEKEEGDSCYLLPLLLEQKSQKKGEDATSFLTTVVFPYDSRRWSELAYRAFL